MNNLNVRLAIVFHCFKDCMYLGSLLLIKRIYPLKFFDSGGDFLQQVLLHLHQVFELVIHSPLRW